MSNLNNRARQFNDNKKQMKKKRDGKQSPVKNTEHSKSIVQRSKTTLNWNQFLKSQNSDLTKTLKGRKQSVNTKSTDQQLASKSIDKSLKMSNPIGYVYIPLYPTANQNGYQPGNSNAVALDCEMVGVGDGRESMLARVSIVDEHGQCLFDTFVKPREPVVDYRTHVSGVRPQDIENGMEFKLVQTIVYKLIQGKILVGHGINNDLRALSLSHPRKAIRDTSRYQRFRDMNKGATPSLKVLAQMILNIQIQSGEHSSVEDARATMNIYLQYKDQWEKDLRTYRYNAQH